MDWESTEWKKQLPEKYLADEEGIWDDDKFIPQGASKEHRDEFRKIYTRYFTRIVETNGFDIDIYPGNAKAAIYEPYLNFEDNISELMELANHAIQEYNNSGSSEFEYELWSIEKVNKFFTDDYCEYFITAIVKNLTLVHPCGTCDQIIPSETFQIHAYKGPHKENLICTCRKKMVI